MSQMSTNLILTVHQANNKIQIQMSLYDFYCSPGDHNMSGKRISSSGQVTIRLSADVEIMGNSFT